MGIKSTKRIKTATQLEKEWKTLQNEILSRSIFSENSPEAIQERIAKAENDVMFFAQTYFPDYYRDEPAPFHSEWEDIKDVENEPVMVKAFRGAGKSTFFSLIDPLHSIIFGKYNYFLFSSYVAEKSGVFSGRILLELMYNQRLINDFGKFIKTDKTPSIYSFTVDSPRASKKIKVQAISIGQDPRGLVHQARRPDYVRLDDIQNRKRARSKKFVKETLEWILADLVPALEEPYNLKIVATPMTEKDVVAELENGSEKKKRKPVITYNYPSEVDGEPLWPAKFGRKRLDRIKEIVGSLIYKQEYLLIPLKDEDSIFKEEDIQTISFEQLSELDFEYVVSWTDPSAKGASDSKKRDYKATVALGHCKGKDYIVCCRIKKESTSLMISGMYEIYESFRTLFTRMFWEDNGGQALLDETFDRAAEDYGFSLPLKAMTNSVNKIQRIEQTLSAAIENGMIVFCPEIGDTKLLVEQLVEFPNADHDDGADALEGARRQSVEIARKRKANIKVKSRRPRKVFSVLRGR